MSKAFEDEGEELAPNEFMDNSDEINAEHRIRVTAKEVCDEAGTALYFLATPVMATLTGRVNALNTTLQTSLGTRMHDDVEMFKTSRSGSVGE
eukprot:COSAG06_NODE_10283_length_1711_cov_1.601737_1_plen_92_part_10